MRQRVVTRHVHRPTTRIGSRVPTSMLALALASVTFAAPAWAQDEPNAADVSAARALGQEGVKLADAGNCAEAIDKLARAEKMFHAPTTLARLGECQVATGKLVEGTENLNRASREALPANAPPAFQAAQDRAKKVLADAKPRLAKLKIAVAAPSDAQIAVRVDGEPVPLANLNTNRPMDPGEHLVEATAPGYKPSSARVKLAEGGVDSVALTLEPDPNAPRAAAASGTMSSTPAGSPAGDGTRRSKAPAYVALGLGVVGVGVGTAFGLLALGKKSDLDTFCNAEKACTSNAQDTIDSGQTFGTVSTVGFGVGIVGIGVGTYLLLTSGSSSGGATSARAAATAPRSTLRVQPVIATDRIGVSGSF